MSDIFRVAAPALVTLVILMSGCSKYENSASTIFSDYGVAYEHYGDGIVASYYILRDDGAELYVTSNLWPDEEPADGERVKFNYEITKSFEASAWAAWREKHEITLYFISEVRTEEPIMESFIMEKEQHRRDSIGDDPLADITKMFFSGGYLNVEYGVYTKISEESDKDRYYMMNLVVDDINKTDDMVTVYLRYNAKGERPQSVLDSNYARKESEVSFNLESLLPENKNSIKIKFIWTELQKGTLTETKTFYRK